MILKYASNNKLEGVGVRPNALFAVAMLNLYHRVQCIFFLIIDKYARQFNEMSLSLVKNRLEFKQDLNFEVKVGKTTALVNTQADIQTSKLLICGMITYI